MNLKNADARNLIILALVAVLGVGLGRSLVAAPGEARETDSARNIIAVTGQFATGGECLYVLDADSRHLSVYRMVDNGRALEFVAARDITYDLKLESYGDESNPSVLPGRLRQRWGEWLRTGGRQAQPGSTQDQGSSKKSLRGPRYTDLNGGGAEKPSGK